MKTHNIAGNAAVARFAAWKRRDMKHWREWPAWQASLRRHLTRVLIRHLAAGGIVSEVYPSGDTSRWQVGNNIFIRPLKNCPCYIADHIANRVTGFGWKLQLNFAENKAGRNTDRPCNTRQAG